MVPRVARRSALSLGFREQSMRSPRHAILIAVLLLSSAVGVYVVYLQYAAENALVRTLSSVAQSRSPPDDADLDLLGMQVQLQRVGAFGAVLRPKFEVSRRDIWPSVLAREVVFDVQVHEDIGLICSVASRHFWEITCMNLRCILKPCVFISRNNWLVDRVRDNRVHPAVAIVEGSVVPLYARNAI